MSPIGFEAWQVGHGEQDLGQHDHVTLVDWLSGACLLIRSSVLNLVGPFDDEYFMYWEDVDLCMRVRKAGLEVWYTHHAFVYHKVRSLSRSRMSYWYYGRNVFLIVRKHASRGETVSFFLIYFCMRFPIVIGSLGLIKRDLPSLRTYVRGVLDGIFLLRQRARQDFSIAIPEHRAH